jgi:hypothetical protein
MTRLSARCTRTGLDATPPPAWYNNLTKEPHMNEADKVEEHYAGHMGIPDGFTDWGEPLDEDDEDDVPYEPHKGGGFI